MISEAVKEKTVPNFKNDLDPELYKKIEQIYNEEALEFKYNKEKNRYEIKKDEFINHFNKLGYNLTNEDFEKYSINNKIYGQMDFKMETSGYLNSKKNELIYITENNKDKLPLLTLKYKGKEFKEKYKEIVNNDLDIYIPIQLEKEGYKVSLNANGGKFIDNNEEKVLNYAYNEKFDINDVEIPVGKTEIFGETQTEYKNVFKYWNKSKSGNIPYKQSEPEALNENLDLYAKWEEYHLASQFIPKYIQNQKDLTIEKVLEDLQIDGFIDNKKVDKSKLTDLKLEEDLDSILATPGKKKIKLTGKLNGVDLQTLADITVIGEFTVDFETNGGNIVKSQIIKEGNTATKPKDPTKENHKFIGWYKDKALEKEFNFETKVTEDMTLYAKWKEKEVETKSYTVVFNSNGGTNIPNQKVNKGEKVKEPKDLTRDGYNFLGWYEDKDLTNKFNFNTKIIENKTLYAKWEKIDKPVDPEQPGKKDKDSGSSSSKKRRKKKEEVEEVVVRPQVENTLLHKAYLFGYEDETIKPENNLTREEASAVLDRVTENKPMTKMIYNYKDVEQNRWSYNNINNLSNKGGIKGYPEGDFKPENKITRAEAATILVRLENAAMPNKDIPKEIKDHWAREELVTAIDKGWIKGYEDGSIRADNFITRAEFVTLVNRMQNRKVDSENILENIKYFKDLEKNSWYYEDIVEATNTHNYKEKRLENGSEDWTEIIK